MTEAKTIKPSLKARAVADKPAAVRAKSTPKAKGEPRLQIDRGSGNVFADLKVADANAMALKSGLAARLADLIAQRGLTQAQVADITGLNQADVSRLKRGQLQEYSSDRIMRALNLLAADVEITVYADGGKVGETFTVAAAA